VTVIVFAGLSFISVVLRRPFTLASGPHSKRRSFGVLLGRKAAWSRRLSVYLIEYTLMMGTSRHYSPSAMAAVRLVRDVKAGGGNLRRIARRIDIKVITLDELKVTAAEEIAPLEEKRLSLA